MSSRVFCWDTTAFIAVFNGGIHRTADEVSGLREVMDMVDRRQARIITSEIIIAEVLDDKTKLNELMMRREFQMISIAGPILRKVGQLRDAARQDGGRSLKIPDASFIAVALAYGAEALHTFDGGVLAMSGRPCVDGLAICKPSGEQMTLAL
ncbi:MAG TPA: type II toxin-antitoxin system VapC family toxin [Gemmatimonadaceae bacterium]|jgi:predicted nucleic acid-binding protein|nr:type II toxin-antitoxin system VapC family toxin [Gemmatimonadaceae bacterium]